MAICNPLLYMAIMSQRICSLLVSQSYLAGTINSVVQTASIFRLSFCSSNITDHFFCDISLDTHVHEMLLFVFAGFIVISTFLSILISYMYIRSSFLRIHSTKGRRKPFSTCATLLTAINALYGTPLFMYLQPSSSHSLDQQKALSAFYGVGIPI